MEQWPGRHCHSSEFVVDTKRVFILSGLIKRKFIDFLSRQRKLSLMKEIPYRRGSETQLHIALPGTCDVNEDGCQFGF